MRTIFSKVELGVLAILAIFLIVVFPILNATGQVSGFTLGLWGKYLCYAILAISVDLLWGYTGLLSLGQAMFFAIGGYMFGMYLMLMLQRLPIFLKFMGYEAGPQWFAGLPWFWKPFSFFPFSLLMVVLLPGVISLVFGWLAFRSRIKGVYFSILTQALTYAAALMFFRNYLLMGGNNGFTDFAYILGGDVRTATTQRVLYICTAILLVLVYTGCRWLTGSRFGLIQRAIRDSETRVLFSGYPVARFKLFVFVVSSIIAALAGALYVPQIGIINPSEMTTDKSLEVIVWVAVGGRGTLVGPVIGAIGVNAVKSWATHAHTLFELWGNKIEWSAEYWPVFEGILFILVVILMPKGIVGLPGQFRQLQEANRLRRERKAEKAGEAMLVKGGEPGV